MKAVMSATPSQAPMPFTTAQRARVSGVVRRSSKRPSDSSPIRAQTSVAAASPTSTSPKSTKSNSRNPTGVVQSMPGSMLSAIARRLGALAISSTKARLAAAMRRP